MELISVISQSISRLRNSYQRPPNIGGHINTTGKLLSAKLLVVPNVTRNLP